MRAKGTIFPGNRGCLEVSRILRSFLVLIILIISTKSIAQSNYHALARIDNLVQQADSLANKSQRTFYLNKIGKHYEGIKETWHYTLRDGKVAVFQIRYVIDSVEFMEIYYVHKGDLIYSEEYETMYYPSQGDDEIKWGGIYYFISNSLKQRATLGNKKSNYRYWDPEAETLSRFEKRFSELRETLTLR